MINDAFFSTLKKIIMNTAKIISVFAVLMLASCSKIDNSQRTAPADYAETERQLIQNREQDSLMGDSINASTAMPPQQKTEQNQNQSGLNKQSQNTDSLR